MDRRTKVTSPMLSPIVNMELSDNESKLANVDRAGLHKRKKSLRDVYLDERSRGKSTVPSVTPMTEDTFSVDSGNNNDEPRPGREWKKVYTPKPLIQSTMVLFVGLFLFTLATIWPPLLLLLFAMVSVMVSYCFRENDFAGTRRKLFQQFICEAEENLPPSFRDILQCSKDMIHSPFSYSAIAEHELRTKSAIKMKESYWRNARGMQLHTVMMLPTNQPIRSVVCFCHGYTDNVSYTKLSDFKRFVEAGTAFVSIEYEGHGLSDGLLGYIGDWNLIIDDITSYYTRTLLTERCLQHKPTFLMGESMGGAVAYDVYNRIPHMFKGVIFVSPMCKISDDMLPAPIVIDALKRLLEVCPWLGYLPLAPSKSNLTDSTYKVVEKRVMASLSPLNYSRLPRLATARECIDSTLRISESLYDFDAPFLIVHGKDDVVTDPNLSQQLYDESQSNDKTLKLYDTMWHSLLGGEPDENVDRVFDDISQWINERCSTGRKS